MMSKLAVILMADQLQKSEESMAILKMTKEAKQIPVLKNITLPWSRLLACLLPALFCFSL